MGASAKRNKRATGSSKGSRVLQGYVRKIPGNSGKQQQLDGQHHGKSPVNHKSGYFEYRINYRFDGRFLQWRTWHARNEQHQRTLRCLRSYNNYASKKYRKFVAELDATEKESGRLILYYPGYEYIPYYPTMLEHHLLMSVDPKLAEASLNYTLERIPKDYIKMVQKEHRLLSGNCWNVTVMLHCLRKMCEVEEEAKKICRKYRGQSKYWPVFLEPVEHEQPQLIQSVDFSEDPSEVPIFLRHVTHAASKYDCYIHQEEDDVVHVFARRTMEWRDAGGEIFQQAGKQYVGYLDDIVEKCSNLLSSVPVARIVDKMNSLKELFMERYKFIVAGWTSRTDLALLCPYCHFIRILQ